jgi:hypothetical protein
MAELLTTGCALTCTFGTAPSVFIADEIPGKPVLNAAFTVATVLEVAPIDNIPPFLLCTSLDNPEVDAATSAALGFLTPMPCVPVVTPWAPPSVLLTADDVPLATVESKCECLWGGVIGVTAPVALDANTDA